MKNVADIYGLSPMQELMLFHARTTERASDVLFNQIVYGIDGVLDRDAYRRAWQLMVDRHSVLRTIFVWQDGKQPLQVERDSATLTWEERDWREYSRLLQETKLDQLLANDRHTGFDLLQAPLMRIHLIRVDERAYWLVWSSHHLVVDRWCIGIILDELRVAYEAFAAGSNPHLPPAPRYRDYIAWLSEQDLNEAQEFWRGMLQDVTVKPLVEQATPGAEAVLDSLKSKIEGDDWVALRRFVAENGVTMSTVISAAWAFVLAAATGATDALFGLTVSGRPSDLPMVDRMVGSFINNVPLHTVIRGDLSLAAFLQDLQERQLDLQAYDYASLAQIQTWSRARTTSSLFDTLLVVQTPVQLATPAGLQMTYRRGGMQTGYPISVGIVPDRDSLRFTFTYDRSRISPQRADQLATALRSVLYRMSSAEAPQTNDLLAGAQAEIQVVEAPRSSSQIKLVASPPVFWAESPEQQLIQTWSEVLGTSQAGMEDRFFESGGDSIKALQLFALIEERLGVDLPISLLFGDPSLAEISAMLGESALETARDPVLVPINETGDRLPLFFTHGVFGGLLWLRHLVPLLEPNQPLYGLQAIGLQSDTEPDRSIEEMAARYVAAIRRVQPAGPYHLSGFCFGGVLAYEVARQLEQLGERTALLAIIDGFPAQTSAGRRMLFDPIRLRVIRESAPYWLNGYQEFGGGRLRDRVLALFGAAAARSDGAATDSLAERNVAESDPSGGNGQGQQLTRINERAGDLYVPQPYGGHVTLIRAKILGVRHALFGRVDPYRGWGAVAEGGVSIRPVDGTHVGMLTPPFVTGLARELNDALKTVAQEHPPALS